MHQMPPNFVLLHMHPQPRSMPLCLLLVHPILSPLQLQLLLQTVPPPQAALYQRHLLVFALARPSAPSPSPAVAALDGQEPREDHSGDGARREVDPGRLPPQGGGREFRGDGKEPPGGSALLVGLGWVTLGGAGLRWWAWGRKGENMVQMEGQRRHLPSHCGPRRPPCGGGDDADCAAGRHELGVVVECVDEEDICHAILD